MTNKRKICISLLVSMCLFLPVIHAQRTSVNVSVDKPEILIGEQALVILEIKTPKGRQILTPEYSYGDTIVKGIEVLGKLKPDTVINHDVMSITQRYVITSFDSTLYNIPYMYVVDANDTIRTKNFGIKVTSPILPDSVMSYLEKMNSGATDSIDFKKLGLRDIKNIQDPDLENLSFAEKGKAFLKRWFVPIIIALVLFIILVVILFYFIFRKKKKGYFFKPQVIIPPHIVALQHLNKIKKEKLYTRGLDKQYFTELTDALREYIQKRYHINAMEQTSEETLASVYNYVEDNVVFENLREILMLSDLVKFAKYKPQSSENELALVNAYFFINHTKKEEEISSMANKVEDNTSEQIAPSAIKEAAIPHSPTYIELEKSASMYEEQSDNRNLISDNENEKRQ